MTDVVDGQVDVSADDRAKAKAFFDKGRSVAANGNFDYAISMFLDGLSRDPEAIEEHQELRDISYKRKASGGKSIGFLDGMKLKRPSKDDKQNMLNAEKLLAYDPGNTDHMQSLLQSAHRGGFFKTVLWIGPILQKANHDLEKKQDYNKYIVLKDVYIAIKQYKLAADAARLALDMRPNDMDLGTELKNLAAMHTMTNAGYDRGESFTEQVRDRDKQIRLQHADRDVHDLDAMSALIAEAEAEVKANPDDPGKATRLVEALERTEQPEQEHRAIDILQSWFDKTRQFKFRQRIGYIQMKQMARMERSKRAALNADPKNPALRQDYLDFKKEQLSFELSEFQLAAEAYPTENNLKFQVGKRLYELGRYQEAIPMFQQARVDPKFRVDGAIYLGMSFLNGNYVDEADDTLGQLIKEYQLQGDDKSKVMYYWRGRALEQKGLKPEAIAHYSKVAQWDFNYRDVQARIKRLRG